MGEGRPIPVRLQGELLERLDRAAAMTHLTRAAIIRVCLESWLDYTTGKEPHDLPLTAWTERLRTVDGRRGRTKRREP